MSRLGDLIADSSSQMDDAQARSDRVAVVKILDDYRRAVREVKNPVMDIKDELAAWARGKGRVRMDLLLVSAAIHPDLIFLDELCMLLSEKRSDVPDEMIVDILYEIPHPKAVSSLAQAIQRKYDYDIYDEFNIKCLETLAEIGTPEAYAVIEHAMTSSSDRVRKRARELRDR